MSHTYGMEGCPTLMGWKDVPHLWDGRMSHTYEKEGCPTLTYGMEGCPTPMGRMPQTYRAGIASAP